MCSTPDQPPLRIVLLTGIEYHCRYAANEISRHFPLAGTVIEGGSLSTRPPSWRKQLERVVRAAWRRLVPSREDLSLREANANKERLNDRFLGGTWQSFHRDRLGQLLDAEPSGINAPTVAEFVRALQPQLVVVFGTSILKRELIEQIPGFCLNMHTGLVPFYRGTHSAEWAILSGDLAGIGATVHHLIAGVDCGPIVIQGRPQLAPDDMPASINLKLYALATELILKAIRFYARTGTLPGVQQDLSLGRCYRRSDFTPSVRQELAGMFADGRFVAMLQDAQAHWEDRALVDCTVTQERRQSCHCDA